MKIARAIDDEGSNAIRELAIKVFNQAARRTKAQARPPLQSIDRGQLERLARPGFIQPQIDRMLQNLSPVELETWPSCCSTELKWL